MTAAPVVQVQYLTQLEFWPNDDRYRLAYSWPLLPLILPPTYSPRSRVAYLFPSFPPQACVLYFWGPTYRPASCRRTSVICHRRIILITANKTAFNLSHMSAGFPCLQMSLLPTAGLKHRLFLSIEPLTQAGIFVMTEANRRTRFWGWFIG